MQLEVDRIHAVLGGGGGGEGQTLVPENLSGKCRELYDHGQQVICRWRILGENSEAEISEKEG